MDTYGIVLYCMYGMYCQSLSTVHTLLKRIFKGILLVKTVRSS
jgi:hypothetical protein